MGPAQAPAISERNERIASMFRQGLTLEVIGGEFGITRERVRQILKKAGVSARDGGISKRVGVRRASTEAKRDAKYMAKHGMSRADYMELSSIGATKAFRDHHRNSIKRGIAFEFNLLEWWAVWRDSGKFSQRGKAKNSYVMSRIKDSGGYVTGNVCIKTLAENSREAVKKWAGKVKTIPRGVFENNPGSKKPFLAKVGSVCVGYFETADSASAARNAFIAKTGAKTSGFGSGRGWTHDKRGGIRPYVSQIKGMKQARFATQQEAEAFYRAETSRITAERASAQLLTA